MTCDPAANGLSTAGNETDYVLGPGGEQMSELVQGANGNMNWQRTYVYAGGALIATYNPVTNPAYPANPTTQPPTLAMPSFRLTDWLGTTRVTTDASGVAQGWCTGQPYGDGAACSNPPDPHYFTGKERDSESGNDYFGARYYGSSMGRFLSPDYSDDEDGPQPVPYANLEDPQGLNLYAYAGNNPLINVDPDGHIDCPGGGGQDVVCAVQTAVNWVKSLFSGGGSGCTGTCVTDSPRPPSNDPNFTPQLKTRATQVSNWAQQQHWIPPFLGGAPTPPGCFNDPDCSHTPIQSGVMPWGMTGGLGLGLTGAKAATTIAEKLAIEEAMSNPAAGKVLTNTVLKDARWPAAQGWVKMELRSPGGVVVHWVRNTITGAVADFKLK